MHALNAIPVNFDMKHLKILANVYAKMAIMIIKLVSYALNVQTIGKLIIILNYF